MKAEESEKIKIKAEEFEKKAAAELKKFELEEAQKRACQDLEIKEKKEQVKREQEELARIQPESEAKAQEEAKSRSLNKPEIPGWIQGGRNSGPVGDHPPGSRLPFGGYGGLVSSSVVSHGKEMAHDQWDAPTAASRPLIATNGGTGGTGLVAGSPPEEGQDAFIQSILGGLDLDDMDM